MCDPGWFSKEDLGNQLHAGKSTIYCDLPRTPPCIVRGLPVAMFDHTGDGYPLMNSG